MDNRRLTEKQQERFFDALDDINEQVKEAEENEIWDVEMLLDKLEENCHDHYS